MLLFPITQESKKKTEELIKFYQPLQSLASALANKLRLVLILFETTHVGPHQPIF